MSCAANDRYGPWSPDCSEAERGKQLRTLATIMHMRGGANHPLTIKLREAESDPAALEQAWELMEQLPALHRRHIAARPGITLPKWGADVSLNASKGGARTKQPLTTVNRRPDGFPIKQCLIKASKYVK